MPSPTDFNLSPYFDDFSESKKFHRVLFRPAFAVQARELTQSQTILQNQIEKFGDHMFKQGSIVIDVGINKLENKPDIWVQVTVPNEFQPVGKFNIGNLYLKDCFIADSINLLDLS